MIEEVLYEVLNSVESFVDVYPQKAPDNTKPPYITFTLVHGGSEDFPSGAKKNEKALWQVDVYEDSSLKTKKLRVKVVNKLDDWSLSSGKATWRDGYEARVKLYRQIIEFRTKENNNGACNGN